jgi:hypothetical protein
VLNLYFLMKFIQLDQRSFSRDISTH